MNEELAKSMGTDKIKAIVAKQKAEIKSGKPVHGALLDGMAKALGFRSFNSLQSRIPEKPEPAQKPGTPDLTGVLNLLAETTTMLRDLHMGYPVRELHRDLPDLVRESRALLRGCGMDDDGGWNLPGDEYDDEERPKRLTEADLGELVRRAVYEDDLLDFSDSYSHFLEELAELVTRWFGGSAGEVHFLEAEKTWCVPVTGNSIFTPVTTDKEMADFVVETAADHPGFREELAKLLTGWFGGELVKTGEIDGVWYAQIEYNEQVLQGAYDPYDTDVDWSGMY